MSPFKTLMIALCVLLAYGVFSPAARADTWDQMTMLTFSQPVAIPGAVLPAGTYWFTLANTIDRGVVEVFSPNWQKLYAIELTIPTYRMNVTDKTQIRFAERPHDQPEAMLKWYYPGLTTGHEFIYRQREEQALNRERQQSILTQPLELTTRPKS